MQETQNIIRAATEEEKKDTTKKSQYEIDMHQFRKDIDANIKKAEEYLDGEQPAKGCARCMALAHTKLQEAKMWVGKCLEAYGSELPKEYRDKAE